MNHNPSFGFEDVPYCKLGGFELVARKTSLVVWIYGLSNVSSDQIWSGDGGHGKWLDRKILLIICKTSSKFVFSLNSLPH